MAEARPHATMADSARLRRAPAMWAVAVMVVIGFGVRLPSIQDPSLDFHPARQYRGLIKARAIYLEGKPGSTAWERDVARLARDRLAQLEPPILEAVTAAGYRVGGGERPWFGRLLSVIAWTGGAVALFALARRLFRSDLAGVVAAGVMLFLPYTVPASSSFQPDPLLVGLTVAAMWLIVRYDDLPSTARLVAAAAVSSAAVLVKGVAAPYVAAVFVAVLVARHGVRKSLGQRALWGFAALALSAPALYYVVGVVTGGELGGYAGGTFFPSMLTTGEFWRGWARQIEVVTTVALALVALAAGLVLAPDQRARLVMAGLWAAYVLVGVAVTYATATHDYYHLPVVPLVALGVGLAFSRLPIGRGLLATALIVVLASAAVRGWTRSPAEQGRAFVAESARIGELVDHSVHVVFLAEAYGSPLSFYGRFSGVPWPALYDLPHEPPMSLEQRWRTRSRAVEGAEWFVVTDLPELARQPALQRRLDQYREVADDPSYRVYDLREQDG